MNRGRALLALATFASVLTLAERSAHAQLAATDSTATTWDYAAGRTRFRVEIVASGFHAPVSLAFLPDGRLLVADRPTGELSILDLSTSSRTLVSGVPRVHGKVDGGLLDVLVHPDFTRNHRLIIAYASEEPGGKSVVVERARLDDTQLVDRVRLFLAQPVIDNSNEFGARLLLRHGDLFISLGQRDTPTMAQDLSNDLGKIIRIREDGSIPPDNPFAHHHGARPEIWAYGIRNPVGLALDPVTGEMWEHEHGPKGGDEVNIITRGRNYGWPVITYGLEYNGMPVGAGRTHATGMEQPIYYWDPDIGPTGMIFYTGTAFPDWRGSIFLGALLRGRLIRLVVEGHRVVHEEWLLPDRNWRVRTVAQGPDGFLYLGVQGGMIVRVRPM
jgi:glucose/arabinose dehydrogenase